MPAGKHQVKPLPFGYDATKGISKQINTWHHDTHYAGYVNKRNEIEARLLEADRSKANANFSDFRGLKERETFCANGQLLHEAYWEILGGDGKPSGRVAEAIARDFGSVEKWREDFTASAKVALGWAILAWDPSDNSLRNFIGDTQNQGGVWGAVPLVPIDVFEHAYYFDYGPDRAKYIEAFLNNVDWKKVDARYGRFVPKL